MVLAKLQGEGVGFSRFGAPIPEQIQPYFGGLFEDEPLPKERRGNGSGDSPKRVGLCSLYGAHESLEKNQCCLD